MLSIVRAFTACILLVLFGTLDIAKAAIEERTPASYILHATEMGVDLLEFDSITISLQTVASLEDFTIEDRYSKPWNIHDLFSPAVAPNTYKLAFLATEDGYTAFLFLLDLHDFALTQTSLTITVDPWSRIVWSPDSTKLYIVAGFVESLIYDITADQISYVLDSPTASPNWLADGEHFVYKGTSACPGDCGSATDWYFLNTASGNSRALTAFDATELGVEDLIGNLYLEVGASAYSPQMERLYFGLKTVRSHGGPREVIWLMSVDLMGNIRQEVDLIPFYEEGRFTTVEDMFYHHETQSIYLVNQLDEQPDARFKWDILRYTSEGELERVAERSFFTGDTVEVINEVSLSPNQGFLAIRSRVNGINTNGGNSNITIFNVLIGEEVLKIESATRVCSLTWVSPTHLIYGESTEDAPCGQARLQYAANQLTVVSMEDGHHTVLAEASGEDTFYLITAP